MAFHTENSLGSPSIFEVLYLLLAITTFEACCAKSLVARENRKVLDLVPTDAAAVSAIIADERAVAKKKKVCVGVKNGAAGVATKTVYMPTIAGWKPVSISVSQCHHSSIGPYRVRKPFPPQESGRDTLLALGLIPRGGGMAAGSTAAQDSIPLHILYTGMPPHPAPWETLGSQWRYPWCQLMDCQNPQVLWQETSFLQTSGPAYR